MVYKYLCFFMPNNIFFSLQEPSCSLNIQSNNNGSHEEHNSHQVRILLIHSGITYRELWDLVFSTFGVCWVMLRGVVELLACWPDRFTRCGNVAIWRMIPHCLKWCLWWERNARTFEGYEKPSHDLKLLFLNTLFEWVNASGLFYFYSLFDLINSCFFCL